MGEFIRLTAATLLGALISFGTTFYFERRKEQRGERLEARERDRQLQQAIRLVLRELVEASLSIDGALEEEHWWSDPPHDLNQRLWLEYRPVLAALLDTDGWDQVVMAHDGIACFNVLLATARDNKDSIHHGNQHVEPLDCCDISEFWQRRLVETRTPIEEAIDSLRPLRRAPAQSRG
jgi:hypothetical protein